jgi:glycerophosphoryl diester phosphodiesterase
VIRRLGPRLALVVVAAGSAFGCAGTATTTSNDSAGTDAVATTAVATARPPTIDELLAYTRPVALAHAGGDDAYPHSTPYAFAAAVSVGTDVLDLDVQLSADGVLVVHHDETVDRTSNGTGRVAELSYAELQALDNAYWWSPRCTCRGQDEAQYRLRGIRTGARPAPAGSTADDFVIPRFRDIAERFPNKPLNIEIKGSYPAAIPAAQALARELEALGRERSSVVTSFDDAVVEEFRRLAPGVEVSPGLQVSTRFVLGGVVTPGFRIYQLPPDFSGIPVVTADLVARLRANGLRLWLWPNGKGEDEAGYRRWIELGVDGVNASDPPALAAVLPPGSLPRA